MNTEHQREDKAAAVASRPTLSYKNASLSSGRPSPHWGSSPLLAVSVNVEGGGYHPHVRQSGPALVLIDKAPHRAIYLRRCYTQQRRVPHVSFARAFSHDGVLTIIFSTVCLVSPSRSDSLLFSG